MLLLGSIRSIMRGCIKTDNVFFRKPTFNSLYDPFGSPSRGQKPSLPLRKAPPFSPSLSSIVFTPPSVPPVLGDRNPQGREDVAGSAIAPPEFWPASGACAHEGLAGSAYATVLRLFVGWRIVEFADNLQIFGFFLGGFNKKAYFCGKV